MQRKYEADANALDGAATNGQGCVSIRLGQYPVKRLMVKSNTKFILQEQAKLVNVININVFIIRLALASTTSLLKVRTLAGTPSMVGHIGAPMTVACHLQR